MSAAFTIVFTPNGGDDMILGDVAARHTARIRKWGGAAVENWEFMFGQAEGLRLLLGNVSGDFVVTSELEQPSRGAMLTYFIAHRQQLNQLGTLVVTVDNVVVTMANATLKGVEPEISGEQGLNGVRWPLTYTFGIGLAVIETFD